MMTSRDRVIRTLNHEPVDRAPRDLWVTPALESRRGDELAEMSLRYPNDIIRVDFPWPRDMRATGASSAAGHPIDAWGCARPDSRSAESGNVASGPLADLTRLAGYQPPWDLLDKAPWGAVNRCCASTSRFVLGWSEVRPLERLGLLHGAEATWVDLGCGAQAIRDLLALLHEFYCRELSRWAGTDVDGVVFRDDWGGPQGLLIAAEVFRDLFKPLYREYCQILRAADKYVFFSSRGNIEEIFEDLVEIGIDAIHSQLFLMNIESLAEQFRNRVTFWGEIDHQRILPFGTPDEVRAAVRRVRAALDFGHGGLIAQCQWGVEVPFRNVAALFDQWLAPVPMHAHAK